MVVRLGEITLLVVRSANDSARLRPGAYVVGPEGASPNLFGSTTRRAWEVMPLQVADGRLLMAVGLESGQFLYETDGTPEGTRRLSTQHVDGIIDAFPFGDRTLLLANEYIQDRKGTYGRLYAVDPISGGLEWLYNFSPDGGMVLADPAHDGAPVVPVAVVGSERNRFVFWRSHPRFGREPWVSDGTQAGTRLLRDIGKRNADGFGGSWNFLPFGDKALFIGLTDKTGAEPWITDGTPEGTFELKDIYPGVHSSEVRFDQTAVLDDKLYFLASSGPSDRTLWESDGTAAGTRRIDMQVKRDKVFAMSNGPRALALVGQKIFFEGTRISGACPGSDGTCTYEAALYSYHPRKGKVALQAQTSTYACWFSNAYVTALYKGGSYQSLLPLGDGLVFAATGQRGAKRPPACGAPLDMEPWTWSPAGGASQLKQINPGKEPSNVEFIGGG